MKIDQTSDIFLVGNVLYVMVINSLRPCDAYMQTGTSPYSQGPLIRRFYSPTFLWSEGSIVRGFYSPMAYSSNVLYSEDSIVRKCLFRRLDIPKVL